MSVASFLGAIDSGTPAPARPAREAPPRETGGVKWHVTGKSRGVAPPMARGEFNEFADGKMFFRWTSF